MLDESMGGLRVTFSESVLPRFAKPGTGTFSTGGPTTSRRTYSNPGESHQLRNGKQVNLTRITDFSTGMSLNTPDTPLTHRPGHGPALTFTFHISDLGSYHTSQPERF